MHINHYSLFEVSLNILMHFDCTFNTKRLYKSLSTFPLLFPVPKSAQSICDSPPESFWVPGLSAHPRSWTAECCLHLSLASHTATHSRWLGPGAKLACRGDLFRFGRICVFRVSDRWPPPGKSCNLWKKRSARCRYLTGAGSWTAETLLIRQLYLPCNYYNPSKH